MWRTAALCVPVVLLFVGSVAGVEPGKPSKTSIWVATARAIGAKHPDPALRNPDNLAIKFLGPRERAILADEYPMDALDLDFAAALQAIPVPVPAHVSRTKFVDSAMLNALREGSKQIVVLGAGLDTRGFRFQDRLQGVRFFEVDYGPTQEYKKLRVMEIFGSMPAHVSYVAMDFSKDDLLTELRKAGYSENDKTFFIWEGVAMYLPEQAVEDTLRFVRAHSAPGSEIVFNYALSTNPDINNPDSRWAKWGEPWIFGFAGETAAPFVQKQGLEVVSDLSGAELDASGARAKQLPLAAAALRFCIARVPR